MLQYFPGQQFKYVEPRPGDVMFTEADLSKFKKHGWESKVDLKEGLNSFSCEPDNIASGMYLLVVQTPFSVQYQKLLYLK